MKKIIVFILLASSFSIFSISFDFSVGASYRFGYQYSFYKLNGLYEQVTIPLSFSFYPGNSDIFSFGLKNKLGFRTIIYGKDFSQTGYRESSKVAIYTAYFNYNDPPSEYEIYENLSFLIKIGKSAKFFLSLGCNSEFSFLITSDKNFYVRNKDIDYYNSYSDSYNYITTDIQTYYSLGPSFEPGLELINKSKTFCMSIGFPFDFQIPINSINFTKINFERDKNTGNFYYQEEQYFDKNWFNFSFGLEFTLSFYTCKDLSK